MTTPESRTPKLPESDHKNGYDPNHNSLWYILNSTQTEFPSRYSHRVRVLMGFYVRVVQKRVRLSNEDFSTRLGISEAFLIAIKQGIAGVDQGPDGLLELIERCIRTSFRDFMSVDGVVEDLREIIENEDKAIEVVTDDDEDDDEDEDFGEQI